MIKKFFVIVFCIVLTGCGLRMRNRAAFPAELKQVYFSDTAPYSPLAIQLQQLLHSVDATLVSHPSKAAFSVLVTHDHFTYNRPDVANSSLPTTMNYSQTAKVDITDNANNVIIASQSFTTSKSLTLNAGQIYTTNANDLIRRELNQNLISIIYYWLTSENTKDALHHAAIMHATRRAS